MTLPTRRTSTACSVPIGSRRRLFLLALIETPVGRWCPSLRPTAYWTPLRETVVTVRSRVPGAALGTWYGWTSFGRTITPAFDAARAGTSSARRSRARRLLRPRCAMALLTSLRPCGLFPPTRPMAISGGHPPSAMLRAGSQTPAQIPTCRDLRILRVGRCKQSRLPSRSHRHYDT